MTTNEVLKELESYGNDRTRRTYLNHGAREPLFGVMVGDMKLHSEVIDKGRLGKKRKMAPC